MTEDIKRKLEAEEKKYASILMDLYKDIDDIEQLIMNENSKHAEEVKRILAEKESGWTETTPTCTPYRAHGNKTDSHGITTQDKVFKTYRKAKEYAAKIELFLRMSKWADENKITGEDVLYCIWYKIFSIDKPWLKNGIGPDEYEKLNEKFGEEIIKIWVMGEYE